MFRSSIGFGNRKQNSIYFHRLKLHSQNKEKNAELIPYKFAIL